MTLYEDQKEKTVIGLKSFLKGLSRDESKDAVAEAMKQIDTEVLKNREDNLVRVLGSHFDKLKFLRCPQLILTFFQSKKDEAIAKMLEVWMKKYPDETLRSLATRGIYLSIPVIRRNHMDIHALMQMVRCGDRVGYTHAKSNEMNDTLIVPDDPYYALDVEDGRAILGKPSMGAEGIINGQRRSCSIVDELIAIGMLTEALFHHYMYATGSYYGLDSVLSLSLSHDKPKLDWRDRGLSNDSFGTPSCGGRI